MSCDKDALVRINYSVRMKKRRGWGGAVCVYVRGKMGMSGVTNQKLYSRTENHYRK